MGRVSQAQAAQNRERIVATAARLFRERGVAGVSVADVMAEAGLTHGGFYKHFASKDALVAEAVTRAFAEQAAAVGRIRAGSTPLSGTRAASTPPGAEQAATVSRIHAGSTPLETEQAAAVGRIHADSTPLETERATALNPSVSAQDRDQQPAADGLAAFLDVYLSPAHRDHPGTGCPSAGFGGDVARAAGGGETRRAYAQGVEGFARLLGGGEPDLAAVSTMVGALLLSRATAGTNLSDRILAAAREALTTG